MRRAWGVCRPRDGREATIVAGIACCGAAAFIIVYPLAAAVWIWLHG